MELYEAIRKRYSVRAYQDRPVEQETLERVLEAARLAWRMQRTANWW